MDFFNVVNSRRSVRSYLPEPVERAVLEKIVAAAIEAPTGCNEQLKHYLIVDEPGLLEKIRPFSGALKGAPAVIVLLVEPKGTKFGEFWIQDASAAMENMLLAAVALGYGGCWVEGAIRRCEGPLRDLLGVPENLRVWSLMPVGRPAAIPARPEKSSPAQVIHYNRFGVKENK
jgi:nitroreductase